MSAAPASPLRAIPARLRGVFAGAGSDGLNEPLVCEEVLRLTGKQETPDLVRLAYVGTATYDLEAPMRRQTAWFADKGCKITPVIVGRQESLTSTDAAEAVSALRGADVILVSGGNTLYAMERWKMSGVATELRKSMERGSVLCGGSAGAICWFDAGHSDSLDPDTFRAAMLSAAASTSQPSTADESSAAPKTQADRKPWKYARVSCLGFLPGLVCPHYDKTQSNGIPRAEDFNNMLRRHAGERGLGIDHWAALVVEGMMYRVLSLPDKPGSVGGCPRNDMDHVADAVYVPDQGGVPGVWSLRVDRSAAAGADGELRVERALVPWQGSLTEILFEPTSITDDPLEITGRVSNPA